VNKEFSAQLVPLAAPASAVRTGLRSIGVVLAGSALVAACAHLSLPLYFTPVPLSLAPFAVLLLAWRSRHAWPRPPSAPTWPKARWACPSLRPAP